MEAVTTIDETFEDVILPHTEILTRAALRMTGSPAEADDLVQETLLRAFKAFDRLRPDSQIRPWLLRILHNTYISIWRRKKRERQLLTQLGTCDEKAPWLVSRVTGENPAQRPDESLGDEVMAALAELPHAYRDCVLLVDLEDKSYKEAAKALGRPLGTVMSRLFRGRKMLQSMLHSYAAQEGYLPRAA